MSHSPHDPRALRLERLHLRRAPGIPDGFELRCSRSVVMVVGPNGSGKTTTARAIETVLWPETAGDPGLAATAHYSLDGAAWRVEVDGARSHAQRDGVDCAPPDMPAANGRHKYRLPLQELLAGDEDGGDFAERILRESRGGYDLRAASQKLQLTPPSNQSGRTQQKALREARRELERVNAGQRSLATDFEGVGELRASIAGAREARDRVALLELAIEHAQACTEHEGARAALAAFDERMARMTGSEQERLATLDARLSECRERVDAAYAAIAAADDAMARALPGGPLPDGLLPTLTNELELLRAREGRVEVAERVAAAEAACSELREALGVAASEEHRIEALDLEALSSLERFARESGELQSARAALEAELGALADDAPYADADALRRGMSALESWLAEPVPPARVHRAAPIVMIALAVAMLAGGVAAAQDAPLPALLAVAGGVALLVATLLIPRPGGDRRAAFAASFTRLGLHAPASWTAEGVSARLDELRRQAAHAQLAAAREERRGALAARLDELGPRLAAMEARRASLATTLGVEPSTGPAALAATFELVTRWRAARVALQEAHAAARRARADIESVRASLAARLAPFGAGTPGDSPDDTPSLAGCIAGLAEQARRHGEARHARELASGQLEAAARERETLRVDRASLLQGLGLAEGESQLVAGWSAALPSFRASCEREARAAENVRRLAVALDDAGADASLRSRAVWELAGERERASEAATSYDELVGRLAELEAAVKLARDRDDGAMALSEVTRCEQLLGEQRERDMERAVGAVLAGFVQRRTRDAERPAVFHRAQELLVHITHGRWRLLLDDGPDATFRAHDTAEDVGRALDELSSGTRMQLLLAVRLAFVELQEGSGPRPPLLLDETLGASDDARAEAIIQAVLDLAGASGRQLFYFTAQADEAARWQGILQARGIAADVVDLARCRRLAAPAPTIAPVEVMPVRELPPPDGLTHAEYGRALEVPGISRGVVTAGGTHLWHLTDDLALLHHLLGLRVETWGNLSAFVESGGAPLLAAFPEAYPRIAASASALEQAMRLARVGRGRPVDRQAIVESGVISEKYVDVVAALAGEFQGDGQRLVEHLAAGKVKSFRSAVTEKLRGWLLERGYITEDLPLSREEIRVRLLASAAADVRDGLLTIDRIERIVASVLPPGATGGELPVAHPGLAGSATPLRSL